LIQINGNLFHTSKFLIPIIIKSSGIIDDEYTVDAIDNIRLQQ